ncbi:MAG: nucleotide exchange factor GrpE [Minisyncoccia bacterium]
MAEEKDLKNSAPENPEDKIAKLEKDNQEYLDGWKRAKADLINYKKEEGARLENFVKFSNELLVSDLIAVLDSFDLSLVVLSETDPARKGMMLIKSQLEDILKKNGLEKIKIKQGDKFDPGLEEAMEEMNSAEPPGTIAEEISGGYKLHNKVIRPVRVKLSKGLVQESKQEARDS